MFNDHGELGLVQRLGNSIPEYSILSHTWGPEEATYEHMTNGNGKHKAALHTAP
jgi:hypothetical protein